MKKKILYISRSAVDDSPVGIRYNNYKKHLSDLYSLTTLNLTSDLFFYKNNGIFINTMLKLIKKLPWLPDNDILILNRYKKEIANLLIKNNYDAVLIGVLPFSFLLLVKYIKTISPKLKIIVDMTDPVTANISFKHFNFLKQSYLKRLEEKSLRLVDLLIVLNPELKTYYQKKLNLSNIVVIEQGIEKQAIYHRHSSVKKKIKQFTYIGSLYEGGREPFALYKAVIQLQNLIKLDIYGGFKKKFQPPKIDCIYYGGKVNRNDLEDIYYNTDVIVFIDNRNSLQVPGKTLEILTLNKPILFIYYNDDSPTLDLVAGYDGIFITKNNNTEIITTIEKILNYKQIEINRKIDEYYWGNIIKRITLFI